MKASFFFFSFVFFTYSCFIFLSCFLGRGELMMTITAWNHNNQLMVIRDEKATTWTVEKKKSKMATICAGPLR